MNATSRYNFRHALTLAIIAFLLIGDLTLAQPHWQNVSSVGPTGCRAVAAAPNGSVFVGLGGFVYAAAGVFRSTDHGTTWTLQGLSTANIEGLAVRVNGDVYAAQFYPANVYRSTDNGDSWSTLTPLPDPIQLWAIAANPAGDIFVASGNNGVFKSTDAGMSWARTSVGIVDSALRDLYITPDGVLFARSYTSQLYRSTDNGTSWTTISRPFLDVRTFAIFGDSTVLATTHNYPAKLYRSTDLGSSWLMIDSFLVNKEVTRLAAGRGKILAITGSGTYRNDGSQWELVAAPPSVTFSDELAVDSSGAVYSAEGGGLSYSPTFGDSWLWVRDMFSSYALVMGSSPTGMVYAGTNAGVSFRSSDHGASWKMLPYSPRTFSIGSIAADAQGNVYVGGGAAGISRSTDLGETWDSLFSDGSTSYTGITMGDSGLIFAATGNNGLCRSTDNGLVWSPVLSRGNSAVLITKNKTILTGDKNGDFISRSTDRGATWTSLQIGNAYRRPLRLVQLASGRILSGWEDGKIFSSMDDGITWNRCDSTGLPGTRVGPMLALSDGSVLLCCPSHGTYRSMDGGVNWTEWGSGISDSLQVWSFTSDNAGYAYAGSTGVMRTINPLTSISQRGTEKPEKFSLEQNYPNPFNPSTLIRYALPLRSHVTLTVFNMLGQQVATLVNGEVEAGYHEAQFNGSGLASGVYFCRLQAGEYTRGLKLCLVK